MATATKKATKQPSDFTTRLRLLDDRVAVRVDVAPKMSPGGIALPETTRQQEQPSEGIVMVVGPGRRDAAPPAVSEGDRVFFARFAGTDIEVDGQTLRILREEDILGVLS